MYLGCLRAVFRQLHHVGQTPAACRVAEAAHHSQNMSMTSIVANRVSCRIKGEDLTRCADQAEAMPPTRIPM